MGTEKATRDPAGESGGGRRTAPASPINMALALRLAHDRLEETERWLEDREEADVGGTPAEWMPNQEMRLCSDVRQARASIRRVLRALGEEIVEP